MLRVPDIYILYQGIPVGLNMSTLIWQSYTNVILDCSQSKKYCIVIVDDLFTPTKKLHMAKLEDLLKTLLKMY